MKRSKIVISGASGFVGSKLSKKLEDLGFEVVGLKRGDLHNIDRLVELLDDALSVVNLAGAPIVARWSDEYKKILRSSRIESTTNICTAISKLEKKPKSLISTSAVGIYKDGAIFDEYSKDCYDDGFLGELCKEWEKSALKVSEDVRVAIFRFGIVLGKGGGMMSKVLKPFSLGLGGVIDSGKQGFSWIHIDDLVSIIGQSIENESYKGIYNMTSPNPIDNREFTKVLGDVLNRPTILPVPHFMLKLIFSEGSKILVEGQKIYPKRVIEEIGFKYKYPTIKQALQEIVEG